MGTSLSCECSLSSCSKKPNDPKIAGSPSQKCTFLSETGNHNDETREDHEQPKQRNAVYYYPHSDQPLDDAGLEAIPDQRVLEMIVCKSRTLGPWFIALYLENKRDLPLELHYYDIGSVLIYESKNGLEKLRITRYSPEEGTTLKMVIVECVRFVQKGPYSRLSNSCHNFVTEIMSEFTDRQISSYFKSVNIPVASTRSVIKIPSKKGILTVLEKEFLDTCQSQGLKAGIDFLSDLNRDLEIIFDHGEAHEERERERYERKKQSFVRKVLGSLSVQDNIKHLLRFSDFISAQKKETKQEINDHVLKAWLLAKFIVITSAPDLWQNETNLMSPQQVHKEYIYNF